MPHPLQQQIASVRRRAQLLLLVHGIARVLAAVVAIVLLAGWVDFTLHLHDRGLRIMLTLSVVGVAVWATWRFFLQALTTRFSDTGIAFRVQRRFPQLGDRLASAIDFLNQSPNDIHAGSAELRRAVIAETTAAIEDLDLLGTLQPRVARRSAIVAAMVCLVALAIVAWDPGSARLALVRLTQPWSNARWPQENHLVLRERVEQVAFGAPLEIEVVDARGADLPEQVTIEFRYDGEEAVDLPRSAAMQFVGDMMVYRQESVTRDFAYRAVGGDDHAMPWVPLRVVEAPQIEKLEIQLTFPEYTAWESVTVDGPINALRGTRLGMLATSREPLKRAMLHFESGSQFACQLDEDGRSFTVPVGDEAVLSVTRSEAFWFDLVDVQGFSGGSESRYEVRVIEDETPSVTVEKPDTNLFITNAAEIPLRIVARDDLALHQVELRFLRSDRSDEGEQVITLFEGPSRQEPRPAPLDPAGANPDRRLIEYRWDIAALALPPGTQLTFFAAASDYLPQSGQSLPRRVTIITPEELQQRITERQRYIMGQLSRALKLQQTSRSRVAELEIQMQEVGTLDKRDVDQLQAAELTQRQVRHALTDEADGITSRIDSLLVELENNHLDSPELRGRLEGLRNAITQIAAKPLSAAEQGLVDSLKQSQTILENVEDVAARKPTPQDEAVGQTLNTAGRSQETVIASLESLLSELGQWNNYRQFAQEIGQVRREQHELAERTAELGRRTLTRGIQDLTSQELADLNKLARQQQSLTHRFERVLQGMREMRDQLET